MLYIFILSFFISFLFCSSDEFKYRVQQFKHHCQKKQFDKMCKSADSLLPFLQEYTRGNGKNFNKSADAITVENLYTFVKLLGTKRDVSLYKDWVLMFKWGTQEILKARCDIFAKLYPPLKMLHGLVKLDASKNQSSEQIKVGDDEDLIKQGVLDAAQVQRYLLFGRDSKLCLSSNEAGIWFSQQQTQLFALIASVLQKNQNQGLSSRPWCAAASLLAEHLFVIESTGAREKTPFYYELKNLYQVEVLSHCQNKDAMIPSSLLIPQIFLASQFHKKTYRTSDQLSMFIERVNKKLFSIHKTASDKGVDAVDYKMKQFVYQVALLNHYFATSARVNADGFKQIKHFEKAQADLRSNLDEIFKLLNIS